jgi:lambda repressor-like predicted transcriptional regulator
MTPLPTFADLRARTLWVQAALRHKGSSFAAIGRKHGWHRMTVRQAMFHALDAQERAIAEELGVTQQALFPERYDVQGNRLHHVFKNSRRAGPHNVNTQDAA